MKSCFVALMFTDDLKLSIGIVQFGFAKIKGAKINLHATSPTFTAAKLNSCTVVYTQILSDNKKRTNISFFILSRNSNLSPSFRFQALLCFSFLSYDVLIEYTWELYSELISSSCTLNLFDITSSTQLVGTFICNKRKHIKYVTTYNEMQTQIIRVGFLPTKSVSARHKV